MTKFSRGPHVSMPRHGAVAAFGRAEDGGAIVFSLFLFVLMILIGGFGVDLMRYEAKRAKMQATVDSAVLAAANLDQELDPVEVVRDYFSKNGLDPDDANVTVTTSSPNGVDITRRKVEANTRLSLNTMFMHMSGVDELSSAVASAAEEGYDNVEISLIVDISGSMYGEKLSDLQAAAKEFVDEVIDETRQVGTTTVSIIPYNHGVRAGQSLLSRMTTANTTVAVDTPRPYDGALTEYPSDHTFSTCIRFRDDDFFPAVSMETDYPDLRAISPTDPLERIALFSRYYYGHNAPPMAYYECDEGRAEILLHETSVATLQSHIDGLQAGGNTAIDLGMKWGIALLDPAMRPVINDMVDDSELPEALRNRPGDYGEKTALKVIVLMTDGQNTSQYDLADGYKNGPTRIWYSEAADAASADDSGYFLEMPNYSWTYRFRRIARLGDYFDGEWLSPDDLPSDVRQLDRIELNATFSLADWTNSMLYNIDNNQRWTERSAVERYADSVEADARLDSICSAAKQNNEVLIFTIAFKAPEAGETAMRKCATDTGYYFDIDDTHIATAFASIAATISTLRLVQ